MSHGQSEGYESVLPGTVEEERELSPASDTSATGGKRRFTSVAWSPIALSLLVLIVGVSASALVSYQFFSTAKDRDLQRFQRSVQRQQDTISRHVETYLALLRGGAGLYSSQSGQLSAEQFRQYVARINLRERYPGILGVGMTRRVDARATDALTLEMRSRGVADFAIFPELKQDEGQPIVFLEPLDEVNRKAIGYDMFSEPIRRAAMNRARETGAASASGRVQLIQDNGTEDSHGFLIYLPLFSGEVAPKDPSERIARLQGFIYAPFRAKEFFAAVARDNRDPSIACEVFDDGSTDESDLLFRSPQELNDRPLFSAVRNVNVAGRLWTVNIQSSPSFEASLDRRILATMLGGGSLLSLLLSVIVWLEARSRRIAERDRMQIAEANQQVRRSAEQFQLLANTIPQLAWMARPDGDIFWYNQRWYEYTGTTFEQMQGWGWKSVHDPQVLPSVMQRWKQSIASGKPFDMTFPLRGADGNFRPFLTRINPLIDADGKVVLWFGTNTDLSERVKLEERFRLTADAAPVMIWIADAGRHCVWFNRAWLDFTGRSLDESLADAWAADVHPDDIERARQVASDAFDRRGNLSREYRLRRHDGSWRWIIDQAVPLYEGPGGSFSGYIGSCIDIHDMKEAEAQRQALLESERAARAEAERSSRLKDEFLATLSHELRTPLNAILGWAQILDKRSGPEMGEDVKRGLAVITRNARVQSQLIEDLLDMSRVISGKLRLDVQRVDPANPLLAAIEAVRPAAEAKDIRIEQVIDQHVGAVRGDPARLQQVVWNLLTNAIKFTPKGGKVQLTLARVNSHVEIIVADTGEGIAPEFLPHVFDRFRQADGSTTRRHGGLGLGLAIVQSLVEAHGGRVRVSSPGLGHGATFVVDLPLMVLREMPVNTPREHPQKSPLDQRAADASEHEQVLDGVRVLIVDDEPDARELIRRVLIDCKAQVLTAANAGEAVEVLSRERPNVLVSDIGMPGQDGYELIRRIRSMSVEEGGNTPAAALTAFARSEDRRRALLAGYQTHIAKPVEPAELVTVVASLAGRIGAGQES
jgi:PAS domain S-box-containing protein